VDSVLAYFNNVPDSILIVTTDFKVKQSRSINRSPEDGSRTIYRKVVFVRCTSDVVTMYEYVISYYYGGGELLEHFRNKLIFTVRNC
jgi:hypothetical protein